MMNEFDNLTEKAVQLIDFLAQQSDENYVEFTYSRGDKKMKIECYEVEE